MPWTQSNEQELRKLKERVVLLETERTKAIDEVKEVVRRSFNARTDQDAAEFAAVLIFNADAIRDALAPFDSGVRASVADPANVTYGGPGRPTGGAERMCTAGGAGGSLSDAAATAHGGYVERP